jgi:hypothetical protein
MDGGKRMRETMPDCSVYTDEYGGIYIRKRENNFDPPTVIQLHPEEAEAVAKWIIDAKKELEEG